MTAIATRVKRVLKKERLNIVAHRHNDRLICDHCGTHTTHTIMVSEMEDNDPDRQVFPLCVNCVASHQGQFKREDVA